MKNFEPTAFSHILCQLSQTKTLSVAEYDKIDDKLISLK